MYIFLRKFKMFRKLKDKLIGVKSKLEKKDEEILTLKGMIETQEVEKIHKECEKTIHNLDEVLEDTEKTGHVDLTKVDNKHYILSDYPVSQAISYNSNSKLIELSDFISKSSNNFELLVVPRHEDDSFIAKNPEDWKFNNGETLDLYLEFNGGKFYNLINILKTYNLGEPLIEHEFIEDEYTVGLEKGLHMRPLNCLIKAFNSYVYEIDAHCNKKEVNAKSVMNLLLFGASKETEIMFKYKLPEQNCPDKMGTLEHLYNIRHYVSELIQGKIKETESFEEYFKKIN